MVSNHQISLQSRSYGFNDWPINAQIWRSHVDRRKMEQSLHFFSIISQTIQISFARTDRGKPYLTSPSNASFSINITHAGDYVLLATSCAKCVGVDVMCLDKPSAFVGREQGFRVVKHASQTNTQLRELISTSCRGSSQRSSWRLCALGDNDDEQLKLFYRLWVRWWTAE